MSQAPTTTLHTYLGYRDAPAAIDWLQRALGFDLVRRWPEEGGTAAGGTSVWVPEQSEWNYRCRVVDPQGVERTVGTFRPGEPAVW